MPWSPFTKVLLKTLIRSVMLAARKSSTVSALSIRPTPAMAISTKTFRSIVISRLVSVK